MLQRILDGGQVGGLELQKHVHGGIQHVVTDSWCRNCAVQGRELI